MAVVKGSRFGPYEAVGELGSGGMGEVFRARDARLNRDVAIKVLHEEVSNDGGRRARFEAEAKAIAALNHPNIVGIFDTGEADGALYIVTELVAGESLRALLRRGPMPVRKVVDIAAQIADGLAAAHSRGVMHRDLKPENVMITPEGRVKILDFGLARQMPERATPGSSETLAMATHRTAPGAIVGTAAYMSPEQARGDALDFRTDQFSFGLILYEMAAGKQAFSRSSTVETLAAIIREEPPPLAGALPAPLRWIVERCLAKEPHARYDSTLDLYHELCAIRDHLSEAYSSDSIPAAALVHRPSRRWRVSTAVFGAASLLLFGALVFFLSRPRSAIDNSKITYTPLAVDASGQHDPVWSPDGKAIAFYRNVHGRRAVFVRYLNSPAEIPLSIPYPSMPVRWSPDGKRIFVGSNVTPRKMAILSVPLIGGSPEHVMDLPDVTSCDVSPRGTSAACLVRSPGHGWTVAFSAPLGSPLQARQPDPFADEVVNSPSLSYSQDGSRLLYIHLGGRWKFWDIPVDAKGSPRLLSLPIPGDFYDCTWLPDQRHVLLSVKKPNAGSFQLWIADTRSSEAYQITQGLSKQIDAAVSPDGQAIAYEDRQENYDIVSVPLAPPWTPQKLVATDRNEDMPSWAAHAKEMVYFTDRDGPGEIWLRTRDGAEQRIVSRDDFRTPTIFFMDPVLSPDGKRVLFTRGDRRLNKAQLWIMPLDAREPMRLNEGAELNELGGSWSPDGAAIVSLDYIHGENRIVVQRVGESKRQILARGSAAIPEWSPTGEWITFEDEKGRWHLITPDGKTTKDLPPIKSEHLAFSRDGKRLYTVVPEGDKATLVTIDIATNKLTELHDFGPDLTPDVDQHPGIRFSLTPDDAALTYSVVVRKSNLWLLQGFPRPGSQFGLFRSLFAN